MKISKSKWASVARGDIGRARELSGVLRVMGGVQDFDEV